MLPNSLESGDGKAFSGVSGHGLGGAGSASASLSLKTGPPPESDRGLAPADSQSRFPRWVNHPERTSRTPARIFHDFAPWRDSDRGYDRPPGRPRASSPATYCSSTPRIRVPTVARWHAHLHCLATQIHETSGLEVFTVLYTGYLPAGKTYDSIESRATFIVNPGVIIFRIRRSASL